MVAYAAALAASQLCRGVQSAEKVIAHQVMRRLPCGSFPDANLWQPETCRKLPKAWRISAAVLPAILSLKVTYSHGWISATGGALPLIVTAAILRLSTSRPAVISLTESAGECGTRASETTGMMPRSTGLGLPLLLGGGALSFRLLATEGAPPLEPAEFSSLASCSRLSSTDAWDLGDAEPWLPRLVVRSSEAPPKLP